jgi:hypothetical protein
MALTCTLCECFDGRIGMRHAASKIVFVEASQFRHVVLFPLSEDLVGQGRQQMTVDHGRETQRGVATGNRDWRHEILPRNRSQIRQRMCALRLGKAEAVFLPLGERAQGGRDIRSALLNDPGEETLRDGDATSVWASEPPADCPAMVTRAGSPPKAAMFSRTHCSAAT